MADQAVPSSDAPQALFDVLHEALVHFSPIVRWEQDPSLFEFMLHSRDLPLGALLRAMLPTSVLRQQIQMPFYLDAKLDFAVDFYLPSLVASSQPLRLPDGRWELGTSI